MNEWLCNKCEVGVLDPDKKVRSPKNRTEAVVICPECGAENPVWSFTNDPDVGLGIPEDNISVVPGGVPSDSDVEPFMSSDSGPIPPGIKHGPPDTGIAFLDLGDFSLNFIQDGVEIGSLRWLPKEKVFRFEGQLDGSSEIFFEVVKRKFKEWHEQKYDG